MAMSDHPIFCTAQTFRGTRDEPAEFCEETVDDYGAMCERHDEEDRAAAAYEAWREDSRYDD
jgi:hypothetical protein